MRSILLSAVTLVMAVGAARGANPVSWALDQTLTRSDTSRYWTSPTAIDLGLVDYQYSYEITRVQATVLGITVDVTSDIGQSFDLTGSGSALALPVVLIDSQLNDGSTGTMAGVRIGVDASGYGQAAFTDIALGQADVPIFGRQNIQKIRVEATITLVGSLPVEGDYNLDGAVDYSDYFAWRGEYGATGTRPADGNGDGVVDAADYTLWRDRFESPLNATTVPEPTALALASLAGGLALGRRR